MEISVTEFINQNVPSEYQTLCNKLTQQIAKIVAGNELTDSEIKDVSIVFQAEPTLLQFLKNPFITDLMIATSLKKIVGLPITSKQIGRIRGVIR